MNKQFRGQVGLSQFQAQHWLSELLQRPTLAGRRFRLTPIALAVGAPVPGGASLAYASDQRPAVRLQEVIVTAQQRRKNMQSTPVSLQAITSTELRQPGVKGFSGYAQLIPSLSFTSTGPGAAQLYIRGLADGSVNFASQSGTKPSVAVYLDQTP